MKQIKSILHPDRFAYELDLDLDFFGRRGEYPLVTDRVGMYETYNDGMTKHCPAYCIQRQYVADFCMSMSAAMLSDPLNEELARFISYRHSWANTKLLQFSATVVYEQGKQRWYNLSELKISSSKSKQFDKRWEEINCYMDGTGPAFLRILDRSHYDWLSRIELCFHIWDTCGISPTNILPCLEDLPGEWNQAVRAYMSACHALELLSVSKRTLQCAVENSHRQAEEAAAAKAA